MLTLDLTDEQINALLEQLPEERRERLIRPFAYPESGEWILESVPGDERMDAETFAAVQEGLADMVAGRLYTPDEVREYVLGSLATKGRK
ncbi:MAG: hypothetical protein H7Y38_04950 [Armatimonadetes bacterium]|nr:hypothetical protein [Armatimonadota bacterium]